MSGLEGSGNVFRPTEERLIEAADGRMVIGMV